MTRRRTRWALLVAAVTAGVTVGAGAFLWPSDPDGPGPESAEPSTEPDATVTSTVAPSTPSGDGTPGERAVEPSPFPPGFELDPATGSLDPPLSTPLTGNLPDPVVVAHDGAYYAFGTNVGVFGATVNVPVYRSYDLEHWELRGDALPELPPWAAEGRTWAPGIVESPAGGWVLYFTARWEADPVADRPPVQCIGRAVASAPPGPFVDTSIEPFVCPVELGGAIDPSPFRDGDELWLHWKNDGNARGVDPDVGVSIYTQRLSADGLRTLDEPRPIIVCDCVWEGPLIENPFMLLDAQRRYWLFYSANWFDTDLYAIGVAECEAPAGPCFKRSQEGPWFGSDATVSGPGGASLFRDDDGVLYMAYHGWEPGEVGYPGGDRTLRLARVRILPTGPTVER